MEIHISIENENVIIIKMVSKKEFFTVNNCINGQDTTLHGKRF